MAEAATWTPPEVAAPAASWTPPEAAQAPVSATPSPSGPPEESGRPPADFSTLYAGIDGLDQRVAPDTRAALAFLDRTTDNPKEARARAINRTYLQTQLPGMSGDAMDANWGAVKDAYAKNSLGIEAKGISDEALYGAIGKRMQETAFAQTKEWAGGSAMERFGMLMQAFPKHFKEETGKTMEDASKPFAPLPSAPADVPNIPSMGFYNPALGAAVYNSVFKPIVEGIESPLGVGTVGIGAGVGAAAKAGVPAAGAALKGMQWVFSAAMAKAAAEATPEMTRTLGDPNATLQQKGEAVGHVVTPTVMALAGVVSTLVEQAPKAAKAMDGKEAAEIPATLHEEAAKAKTPEEKQAIHATMDEVLKATEGEQPKPLPPSEPLPVSDKDVKMESAGTEITKSDSQSIDNSVRTAGTQPLAGIKNAVVDEEMAKMGLDPAEHGEGLSWEQAKADADAKLAADPYAGQKLVKALAEKPRPITGQEDALLLTEVNRLKLERDAAEEQLLAAKKAGDRDAEAEANVRIAAARDAFTEASETATKVGTPQAQGLALRRMMMREDYSLASMERQLAAATKDGKLTPEQSDTVRKLAKDIRETGADLDKYNARRLKAFKTRTAKATAELQERVAKGDLKPRPKPEPVKLDLEGELLKAAHERAKQAFDRAVLEERIKNRSFYENGLNTLVKWRRGFLLSSPITIAKLTAAAAWRMGTTLAEEGVGTALSKLPGVSKVAEKAPRYGAANSEAEAAAITQALTAGMKDAWDLLRTGKSNLDVIYGHGKDPAVREYDIVPRSVIDFFGSVHGALKAPVKRAEFARSFQKRVAFAIRNGVDASNPMVQTRIAIEAYKDANRAIFLQDNLLTDFFKRGLSAFEQTDPKTGGPKYASGKMAASAFRMAFPIVKVPTNIVAETFEFATGTVTGSWRLGKALRAGVADLPPEQADLIMRNLQKGSLGAGALLLGYFAYDKVGGFYQQGEKRKPGDVKAGSVKVFGEELPSYLLHHPMMETVQLGATIRKVEETKLRKKDAEAQGLGTAVWAGALGLIEEVPYARGAAEYTKLFDPKERQYETGQIAKDIVDPQLLQWIARVTDVRDGVRIDRKPGTVPEAIKAGIPGLRQTVPERKRDPWTSYKK